jgi:hypothetical protein
LDVYPQMKKLPAREPEVAIVDCDAQQGAARISGTLGIRERRPLTERAHADIGRTIAHEEQHGHDHDDRAEHQEADPRAPAVAHGELHHRGHEDELTHRRGRAEQPDDQAAVRAEPAVRDRRAGHLARDAGPDADEHAPDQEQLPQIAQRQQEEEADGDRCEARDECTAGPDAVDECPTDRPAEAERDEADRNGERDERAIPAELALEGNKDDTRRRADRRRREQREERHRGNDPRVMEAAECHERPSLRNERTAKLLHGEVSEWLMVPLSKSGRRKPRGFESRPLRRHAATGLGELPVDRDVEVASLRVRSP